MTIVCGDSHTSTHGAFGALAFGIGTSEVEMVLATQTPAPARPEDLRGPGRRPAGARRQRQGHHPRPASPGSASAAGPATSSSTAARRSAALTMEQRMTICNMSIEGGARAGLIAPDDTTFEYVARPRARAAGRGVGRGGRRAGATLPTDDGATFDRSITIDAYALEPMVTYGTNPGMGIPITVARALPRRPGRPGPAARARARARVHGPPARASRSSARRSTSSSSAAARTAGSATCGWPPAALKDRTSPTACG